MRGSWCDGKRRRASIIPALIKLKPIYSRPFSYLDDTKIKFIKLIIEEEPEPGFKCRYRILCVEIKNHLITQTRVRTGYVRSPALFPYGARRVSLKQCFCRQEVDRAHGLGEGGRRDELSCRGQTEQDSRPDGV